MKANALTQGAALALALGAWLTPELSAQASGERPAADRPPVKVFILAGQSNMQGHGVVPADPERNGGRGSLEHLARDPASAARFGHLLDDDGDWSVREDVLIWYLGRKGGLSASYGARPDRIGPELGFGHVVGDHIMEPVVLIKIAWGGKSLAVDFRPPSAGGETGPSYRELLQHARSVSGHLDAHFPQLAGRRAELAGIGWHQGWNDRIDQARNDAYEENLAHLIRDLRRDLDAPALPFVIAETGMSGHEEEHPRALSLMRAQAAVAEYQQFEGNVAFVGTRDFYRPKEESPSGQAYHWNQNAETYWLIGRGMGEAMLRLLEGGAPAGRQGPNPAAPVELRCDGQLGEPFVGPSPALSWRLTAAGRGQQETAWQVLVASEVGRLQPGRADLWDSGRVAAGRAPARPYGGAALAPGDRAYWMVRSWDAAGRPSAWSEPAAWNRAPSTPADWRGARWIDDGRPVPERDEDLYTDDPAPLFRREFRLDRPVVRATLHLAGLGWGQPRLNGQPVGDHALDPPWTNFERRILYSSHEVTALLRPGDNCLGVALGNGWYQPLPLRMWGHRNIRDSLPTGRPRLVACLVMEHADGRRSTVLSGPGWKTAGGPLLRNNIYLGEVHDARRNLRGWDQPGFDDAGWAPARVTEHPLEPLQPRATPPVRPGAPLPALAVSTVAPGVHLVDFGRNFTGVPELELELPTGTQIHLRYGELLDADGGLNPLTSVCGQIKGTRSDPDGRAVSVGGPGAPPVAWQQDVYTAAGGGPERCRPAFSFHGFRYLELSGLPRAPAAADIRGIPLHSDVEPVGSFSCSSELLNRIQGMCQDTFLANLVSVQSDCPHRERFAYGGDIAATSEALIMNFDMSGFYAKTARDWADAARPDGRFTDTAPFVGIDYCGVGWAMVHPLLLEQLHRHYGAPRLLEEQLPAALRWFDTEAAARQDGLVVRGLGDHEALDPAGGPAMLTPMFVDAGRRLARLSRLLGRDADAARCQAWADESAAAWADAFLDRESGAVAGGSQSELACALGFGVVPPELRQRSLERLAEAVLTDAGPRLRTGIFGTRFLLEELCRGGRPELALSLAASEELPSWGWMLANGATTLWEHWAGSDDTYSHNHPMFGSVSAWFYRWLGGIQAAEDAVGFDRIRIRPQVLPGLEWVRCSHRSIRGEIVSAWRVRPEGVRFEITIPPTATAVIELPARPGDELLEAGAPVAAAAGIELLVTGDTSRRLQIGSGSYRFFVRRALP